MKLFVTAALLALTTCAPAQAEYRKSEILRINRMCTASGEYAQCMQRTAKYQPGLSDVERGVIYSLGVRVESEPNPYEKSRLISTEIPRMLRRQ